MVIGEESVFGDKVPKFHGKSVLNGKYLNTELALLDRA